MSKKVRLKDIADRAGVSIVSVSKALSGQRGVSEETRKKIEDLAQQMGYRAPSSEERKFKTSYNIGILIESAFFSTSNSFYGALLKYVNAHASEMKCFTMLEVISQQEEEEMELPQMIREKRVDGIIIIGILPDAYLSALMDATDIPILCLDFTPRGQKQDSVISDNFYGAYRLTNYLFELGHRKIAYVGTVLATSSITDRYLGYRKSMMEHGVSVPTEWVIADRDQKTGIIDKDKFFPLPKDMPTAFVCNCDLTAAFLERKLYEKGLRVPENISIVGYDHFTYEGVTDMNLKLTTYEVDLNEMARKAVHNLVHKLNGEYYRKGMVIVTGRMIIGDSTRKIETCAAGRT